MRFTLKKKKKTHFLPAFQPVRANMQCINIQRTSPISAGISTAASVHLALRVSRRMVRQVVEHGACATVSTSVQSAVCTVQPFASSSARKEAKSTPEAIVPDER